MLGFFLALLICYCCSKEKREDKRVDQLTGTWELIYMTDSMPETYWTFTGDSTYEIERSISDTSGTIIVRSHYLLTLDNYKYYITIDSLDNALDGKFLIHKLNKEILILERIEWKHGGNPFLRQEFVRL
ncbi:MAG: hypothetical protein KJ607_06700 [Bacteroidetes bacterium]|nr:hypothetical protein [Bacteroidota bacterium]